MSARFPERGARMQGIVECVIDYVKQILEGMKDIEDTWWRWNE